MDEEYKGIIPTCALLEKSHAQELQSLTVPLFLSQCLY